MMLPETKQQIEELVAKYQSISQRERREYNEANTKNVFVQPLFEALGWDFSDLDEVEAEKTIVKGRVDYLFKINRVSKFCLEVKPLRDELTNDHRKQAISYAYNKGVTWAVLTNFDRLQVFNAERQAKDPDAALCLNLNWQRYLSSFDTLWLLSREAVAAGSLDKEAEKFGKLPLRIPVEKHLYELLRVWRERLFSDIYNFYKRETITLSDKEMLLLIDRLIQGLFNRLLFIRTAEDRDLARDHPLLAALHQWESKRGDLIERLRVIFNDFAEDYDSDLFPSMMDAWQQIWVSGDLLAEIIKGLYEVPGDFARYDFAVIDADVLGQVYEQYLGYVAQVAKQKAKEQQLHLEMGLPVDDVFRVEEKKEKRKAAGIYYTPKWVTDYIVKETVGRFIEEHGDNYDKVHNVRILDPACGSGSFLIRAYDELLSYHARVKGITVAELDYTERIAILTRNIYGVDLDPQAVEIARLNLLLRALAKRELLPSLADNIRCGNSLISGSDDELRHYFGSRFKDKKPFTWKHEFPEIMKQGGFDIVIGNPPYVGFQGFIDPEQAKAYLRAHYDSAIGRFDTYLPFLERGVKLLKERGLLGFICPTNFMKRQYGKALRQFLLSNCKILRIVDFQDFQVFEEALNYTGIFILEKSKATTQDELQYVTRRIDNPPIAVNQRTLTTDSWIIVKPSIQKVIYKIKQSSIPLEHVTVNISEGIVTGKNEVFILTSAKANSLGLERDLLRTVLKGKQIRSYYLEPSTTLLLYPYHIYNGKNKVIPQSDLETRFPSTWRYLNSQRHLLSGRSYFDNSRKAWYELWCERSFNQQATNKIVVSELASTNRFAYCGEDIFYLDTACGIIPKDKSISALLYLLGILNSSLMEFYYKLTTVPKASGFYIYKTMYLKDIPVRSINYDNPVEKKLHDDLIALVNNMLELQKMLADYEMEGKEILSEESRELKREIKRTDARIDQLVYELYGLTEEETEIIEAEVKRQ